MQMYVCNKKRAPKQPYRETSEYFSALYFDDKLCNLGSSQDKMSATELFSGSG